MKRKNQIIGLLQHIIVSTAIVFILAIIIALPILLAVMVSKWFIVLYLVYFGIVNGWVGYQADRRRLW